MIAGCDENSTSLFFLTSSGSENFWYYHDRLKKRTLPQFYVTTLHFSYVLAK